MKIIGICGKAGSGKSAVSDIVRHLIPASETLSFAAHLKKFAEPFFPHKAIYGSSSERAYMHPKFGVTCREFLQRLGTDFGREMIHPDIWCDSLIYAAHLSEAAVVVVMDCRFLNEMQAIKESGGTLWRTLRGVGLSGAAGQHPSELDFDKPEAQSLYDHVFDNREWTLEELAGAVRNELSGLGLLL